MTSGQWLGLAMLGFAAFVAWRMSREWRTRRAIGASLVETTGTVVSVFEGDWITSVTISFTDQVGQTHEFRARRSRDEGDVVRVAYDALDPGRAFIRDPLTTDDAAGLGWESLIPIVGGIFGLALLLGLIDP